LREAVGSADGLRLAYRALRQVSRALEALYPLAAMLPTVSRYFLVSDDEALAEHLAEAKRRAPTSALVSGTLQMKPMSAAGSRSTCRRITTTRATIRW
jgi:phospholipase/carboxylesterase